LDYIVWTLAGFQAIFFQVRSIVQMQMPTNNKNLKMMAYGLIGLIVHPKSVLAYHFNKTVDDK